MKKIISLVLLILALFSYNQSSAQGSKKFSIYFDVNQYRIKPEFYKVLDSVVTILSTNTNIRRIQINGYADTIGNAAANMELSDNRTDSVANYILNRNLQHYKKKISTSSLGEKVGKDMELDEMRRVDVELFFAKPDRDTLIRVGCVSAFVPANTFDGFNNNEISFKLEYVSTAAEASKNKLVFKDEAGSAMLSNGVVRLIATYKNKAVKSVKPITIKMPAINNETGYSVYKGILDKNKNIAWKKSPRSVTSIGKELNPKGGECDLISYVMDSVNWFINCGFVNTSACYCSGDPFGGMLTPNGENELARFGEAKSIVLLNAESFKKVAPTKAKMQVLDNIVPSDYLTFCNSFLYPGVSNVPQIPKSEREVLRFIDFNVSENSDPADVIMNKKNKVLVMVPKSAFPFHKDKKYAMLYAETKKDNFYSWTNKAAYDNPCLGLVNCNYWVFEVPLTGFYSLVEVSPLDKKNKDNNEGSGGSTVKIRVKKSKDAEVIYGSKDNATQSAVFVKNKGSKTILDSKISKSEKKEYKDQLFLAYKIEKGKRYAWIGTGRQLKTGIFSGMWKTPKLAYVPDEEWENFVKRACE